MRIEVNLINNDFKFDEKFSRQVLNNFTACDEFRVIKFVADDYKFKIQCKVQFRDRLANFEIFGCYSFNDIEHQVALNVMTESGLRIYEDARNMSFGNPITNMCGADSLDDCSDCECSGNCDRQDELSSMF